MSKPFPDHGTPLSWQELIDVAGRTEEELTELVTRITKDLSGTKITPCPSKQCIVADVDVDEEDVLHLATAPSDGTTSTNSGRSSSRNKRNGADPVEDYVDQRLRRVLQDSGTDHTIINGITRLPMPDDATDGDELRKQRRAELYGKFFKDDEDEDAAPSSVHQHYVFKTIWNDILEDRIKVTKENLDNTRNAVMFIVVPAICAVDTETGYFPWRKVPVNKNHVQQKSR